MLAWLNANLDKQATPLNGSQLSCIRRGACVNVAQARCAGAPIVALGSTYAWEKTRNRRGRGVEYVSDSCSLQALRAQGQRRRERAARPRAPHLENPRRRVVSLR